MFGKLYLALSSQESAEAAGGDNVVQILATRWKRLCDKCFDSLLKNIYNDSHYLSISLNAYFVDLKSKNKVFYLDRVL